MKLMYKTAIRGIHAYGIMPSPGAHVLIQADKDSRHEMELGVWGMVGGEWKLTGHIAEEHASLFSAFMGFFDVDQLTWVIGDPLKVRYSPRAGGTECQLLVKLVGDRDTLVSIARDYPQYYIL